MGNNSSNHTINEAVAQEIGAIFENGGYALPADPEDRDYLLEDGADWVDEIDPTNDDFAHYLHADGWSEARGQMTGNLSTGEPYVYWDVAQAAKGRERVRLLAVDLGHCRAVVQS